MIVNNQSSMFLIVRVSTRHCEHVSTKISFGRVSWMINFSEKTHIKEMLMSKMI